MYLQQVRRKDRKKGILQKGTHLQQVRRKDRQKGILQKGTHLQQVSRKDRPKGILQKGTHLQQVRRNPKKTRKNRNSHHNTKWNGLRVDQHQRRIGMEHYKKPAWLDKTDALDLEEYEKHFQSLNQGQLCSSIVFFLSLLFSVIHSWKPDKSFKNYCPENTSPARALCFLNRLRLTEEDV